MQRYSFFPKRNGKKEKNLTLPQKEKYMKRQQKSLSRPYCRLTMSKPSFCTSFMVSRAMMRSYSFSPSGSEE